MRETLDLFPDPRTRRSIPVRFFAQVLLLRPLFAVSSLAQLGPVLSASPPILHLLGFNAHQIGPWIASDAATAEELFKAALSAVPGKPIFFDVVVPNEAAMAVAKKYNFELQRPFLRMFLGENKYPADTRQMYAISGVEKG